MIVGIIGAMKVEVAELIKSMQVSRLERISLIDFYTGTINGCEVVLAASGAGKVNAAICAQTMILRFSPDIIINTGVAGSLSDTLALGDFAIASSVVQYDIDTTAVGDPLGMVSGVNRIEFPCDRVIVERLTRSLERMGGVHYQVGLIATGDRFLKSGEERKGILDSFDAIACEMEGGSIGLVCYMNDKQFGIIRSISDNADDESSEDYFALLDDTALKAANAVKIFLEEVRTDG